MLRYKLRTLLIQFSLRDLFWLILLAAVISYAYRDRLVMNSKMAAEKTQLEMKILNAVDSMNTWMRKSEGYRSELRAITREQDELEKERLKKLDMSYPLIYPHSLRKRDDPIP